MDKRTLVGLCAALAFTAGSPAVHALKIVPLAGTAPSDEMARDSNTYAREMLSKEATQSASDSTDMATYYTIDHSPINIAGTSGIGGSESDAYSVAFSLENMVFGSASTPELGAHSADGADKTTNAGGDAAFELISGGGPGDKQVVFRKNPLRLDYAPFRDDFFTLQAQYAISEAGPGSITMTVTNHSYANVGVTGVVTDRAEGIIMLGSALREMVTTNNPTATAADGFRSFGGSSVATVGSLHVNVAPASEQPHILLNDATGARVADLTDIVDDEADPPVSTVSIMGDFSFANNVYLHANADCMTGSTPPKAPGILEMDDDGMLTGAVADQDVANFANPMYLCIAVDPTDENVSIPETTAYTVMGNYEAQVATSAFPPASMEMMLGMIMRDGTEVRIPYLTTYEGYNQRIVLSNRGHLAAPYEMTFTPETGVMAEGTDMATGTLPPNSTVTYKATDLVTLTGGSRTEARITLVASRNMIDVTSVIVNKESRNTDTVVHQ